MANESLWITNDGGKTYFNLTSGGATAINFVQRIKISNNDKAQSVTISGKAANSTLIVIPVTCFDLIQPDMSLAVVPVCTTLISVSGSVVTFHFNNGQTGWPLINDGLFYFDVYETINTSVGAHGLFVQSDIADFGGITDATKAGFCVYRTTVSVSKTWDVPASIPARNNCSVFANWNHSSAVVEYSNQDKRITVTGGPVTLNIAIFSNGFNLTIPDYGFYICNDAGKCTYNSNYIPLFLKKTIPFNGSAVNTGVAKPMIPLTIIGGEAANLRGSNCDFYNKRVVMTGSTVKGGRGKLVLGATDTGGDQPYYNAMTMPLIVLDGAQYFN